MGTWDSACFYLPAPGTPSPAPPWGAVTALPWPLIPGDVLPPRLPFGVLSPLWAALLGKLLKDHAELSTARCTATGHQGQLLPFGFSDVSQTPTHHVPQVPRGCVARGPKAPVTSTPVPLLWVPKPGRVSICAEGSMAKVGVFGLFRPVRVIFLFPRRAGLLWHFLAPDEASAFAVETLPGSSVVLRGACGRQLFGRTARYLGLPAVPRGGLFSC